MTRERDQLGTALGLSAVVNAGLFLAIVWVMAVERGLLAHTRPAAASPPEMELAEMEIVISAEPEPAPRLPEPEPELAPMVREPKKPPLQAGFVEAPEDTPEESPENPETALVSNRSMRAASELDPSGRGAEGLPTLNGRPDVPTLDLRDQDFQDGATEGAGGGATPPASSPAMVPPPSPMRTPEAPAPLAFQDSLAPDASSLPVSRPMDRPPDSRPPETPPSSSAPGMAPLRSQLRTSKVEGGATRKGPASVDARETAVGRYNQGIQKALNKSWRPNLRGIKDLASRGLVEVYCEIDATGKPHNVRLLNPGGANPVMQDNAVTAVINTRFPPPPAELLEGPDRTSEGRLRRTIPFLFY